MDYFFIILRCINYFIDLPISLGTVLRKIESGMSDDLESGYRSSDVPLVTYWN
jgi:hypothetical protein